MRKKLLFCSALLLSASLAGCGYNEDNIHETVPVLPDTCSSTNDCVAGSNAGQCVDGHCLRYCENRTDCEEGTICESGLCRHIEDCPRTEKSKNSKCLKVFKHSPTTNWTALLKQDVRLDTISGRNASTNFTSKNFTLQIPNRSLMGGLNYSLVMGASLTYILLENMASTLLMQCVMPDTLNSGSSPTEYQVAIDKSLEVDLKNLIDLCKLVHDNHVWVDDFPPTFNKDLCTSSSSSYTYMDRFNETKRKAINDKLASYLLTGEDLYKRLKTEIEKKQQDLNLDQTNINKALAKLNEIEIAVTDSTFAKIENEADLSNTDLETLNNTLKKLQDNLKNNQTVLAGNLSGWSAIAVKNAQDYILQLTEIIHMVQTSQATATSLNEHIEDLPFKMSVDRCDQASLAWKTLDRVYKVISQATLGEDNYTKTTTYYVIQWALNFLKDGTLKASNPFKPITLNQDDGDPITINLSLPTMDSCNDLVTKMQDLQTTICYDILYGIQENPLMTVLSRSKMDFVNCLTDTNVAPALIKNGWDFIDGLTKGTLEHTLPNIATVLMMAMSLGDSDIGATFSDMSTMVTSLGDPTFIWLTEGNIQELNIISNQTKKNPFSNHPLILSMEYKPQSKLITSTPVDLNTYGSGSVSYGTNGIPELNTAPISTGSTRYTTDEKGVLSMYSEKLEDNDVYEFFVNPKVQENKKLTCGGVVLDIDTIDGYVVLKDSDIENMNGTALVRDASN